MTLLGPATPYVAAGMVALAAFGGLQTWRIGRLKYEANVAAGKIDALQDAKDTSERLRALEGGQADVSYEGLAAACAGRLPITIQAGRTIERIQNAKPNPDGSRPLCDDRCVRSLVGEDQHRDQAGALPQ